MKGLVSMMRALGFNYHNVIVTATKYAECSPMDSPMEDAIAEQDGRKRMK